MIYFFALKDTSGKLFIQFIFSLHVEINLCSIEKCANRNLMLNAESIVKVDYA